MRQAEGAQTLPVVPRAVMFHGHRLIGSLTQSAGVRITDMEWDGAFRGRAYSSWSMGEVAGDAHSAPSLLPLSDGRLVEGWTGHNANFYIRVTTGESIAPDGWENTRNFGSSELSIGANKWTYASFQETAIGVFTFVRGRTNLETDDELGYWYSYVADPSDAFPTATKFIEGDRPYVVGYPTSPYRRDFQVSTGHPADVSDNSIWHFYMAIDPSTEAITWHKTDGTPLTLPIAPADMTLVYDGTPALAWIEDIVVGPDGHPRMIYAVFNDPLVMGDYTYHYARWTGAAWVSASIADGGATTIDGIFYANGNAAIDPEDVDVVVACCVPDGGSVLQAIRFTSADNGLNWAEDVQLTDDEQQVWAPGFIAGAPEPRLYATFGPFDDVGGIFVGDTRVRLLNSETGAAE